jgi:hypothetical protein
MTSWLQEFSEWLRGSGEWAIFTVAMGLIALWLMLAISWFIDEPLYQVPLHDGTLLTFAIVVSANAHWSVRRLTVTKRGLSSFTVFLVILALALLFYTIQALVTAGLLKVDLPRGVTADIGCAIGATIYSFACNRALEKQERSFDR